MNAPPSTMDVMAVDRLGDAERRAWSDLRRASPLLANPFFSLEFTTQVAALRPAVRVAVLRHDGVCVGFLPFERGARGLALPVATRVSAVHGIVAAPDLEWDPLDLLYAAGLQGLHYDCAPAEQAGLRPFHICERRFPYVDLDGGDDRGANGYDACRRRHRERGSAFFTQIDRKARKLEREVGVLEFELHTADDDEAFALLHCWKSAQYRRTGTLDVLAIDWVRELLDTMRRVHAPGLGGVLSVLRAGGRVTAVHLGLRGDGVLAWWFPSYDPDLGRYSPGLILLDRVLREAASAGIVRLDLGQGAERYKARLATDAFRVAEGVADRRRARRWLRQAWVRTRDWAGRTPRAGAALRLFRALRHRMIRE